MHIQTLGCSQVIKTFPVIRPLHLLELQWLKTQLTSCAEYFCQNPQLFKTNRSDQDSDDMTVEDWNAEETVESAGLSKKYTPSL